MACFLWIFFLPSFSGPRAYIEDRNTKKIDGPVSVPFCQKASAISIESIEFVKGLHTCWLHPLLYSSSSWYLLLGLAKVFSVSTLLFTWLCLLESLDNYLPSPSSSTTMDYDSYDAVLHWIFRSVRLSQSPWGWYILTSSQTQGDAWFKPTEENIAAGVCLRVEPGFFRVFPYENPYLAPFEAAVRGLNPLVAVKVRSAAVHSALATV